MKLQLTGLFCALLVGSCQALAVPVIGLDDPDRIPGQYIVVLKSDREPPDTRRTQGPPPGVAEAIAIRHQARIERKYRRTNAFVARIASARVTELANDPQVAYIETDRIVHLDATQAPATWGLDRVDQRDLPLDRSYTYGTIANAVNVYIIDTGIRVSHTEFAGRARSAYSVINDGRGTGDCNGHGTHVAGTVGGAVYGVAKEVSLHAVRVLDCQGSGRLSGVIAGVDWVTEHHSGPAVANMSLGSGASRALDTAVRNAVTAGVTFVVAAGNDNADACNYSPARVAEAVTVGATASNDARASFSNRGSCVDVFAPGASITSAWNSGDSSARSISGTSMAAPHVAGIAALYLADNPAATPLQVSENIVNNATPGRLSRIGAGSPNRLAHSLPVADGSEESPATCQAGEEVFTGSLAAGGAYEYQPNGTYYRAASGIHNGELAGPAGSDFDLYLWRWNGRSWQTVASSTGPDSGESIRYSGSSGYYVWRIQSASGSGDYTLCLKRP